MKLLLLLLLLLGFLSVGADLLNNELLEQTKSSPEVVNVAQSQSCPSDAVVIVLRDLSVKLAELQCKVDTVLKESQDQAAKLAQTEEKLAQNEAKLVQNEAKLAQSEVQIQALQLENRDQAVKLAQSEVQIQALQVENRDQAAELWTLKDRTNQTEKQVDSLKRDREDERVAFSAVLGISGYIGPFNTDTTLEYKHVFYNSGNVYDKNTGVFTAPIRGVYHFEFYCHVGSGTGAWVRLQKNEENVIIAGESQDNGSGTAGNSVSLQLEVGDTVRLRLVSGKRVYDNSNNYSTFSGRLMFLL